MTFLLDPLVMFSPLILYSTQHCWHLPPFDILLYSSIKCQSSQTLSQNSSLIYIFNLGYLIHSHTFSCIMQTALKSLCQFWILSRTSDTFIKMFTRYLRHLKFHKSQIQLLFSIRKTYSSAAILYLSKRSTIYLAAKEENWVSQLVLFFIPHIQTTTICCVYTS